MMVKLLTMGIQPTIMENKKRQTQNVQIITCSNIVTCGILHDVLRSVSSCGSQCKWDLHNGTICEIFVKNTKHVDSYIHYVYIYMYIYIYIHVYTVYWLSLPNMIFSKALAVDSHWTDFNSPILKASDPQSIRVTTGDPP